MRFAHTLTTNPQATADTKIEFVTLRIFPFPKRTSAFLHELRSLPDKKLRLANIELPKTEAWAKRQREKGMFKRMLEVVNEPRFKFYVKEGRMYTMKTGVPGVWEEVANRIRDQTVAEKEEAGRAKNGGGAKRGVVVRRPVARPVARPVVKPVLTRRQTQRQVGR
jgi:ribosomal protein S10